MQQGQLKVQYMYRNKYLASTVILGNPEKLYLGKQELHNFEVKKGYILSPLLIIQFFTGRESDVFIRHLCFSAPGYYELEDGRAVSTGIPTKKVIINPSQILVRPRHVLKRCLQLHKGFFLSFWLKFQPDKMGRVPGGRYFRNFWVGMCRWDPGTLNLYQSQFS